MDNYCVYQIKDWRGKVYIGMTKDIGQRINDHKRAPTNNYIHRAIRKHGIENFYFSILEDNLTFEQARDRESYHIKRNDSTNPRYGYNRESYSEGRRYVSQETKRQMSESATAEKSSQWRHDINDKKLKILYNILGSVYKVSKATGIPKSTVWRRIKRRCITQMS